MPAATVTQAHATCDAAASTLTRWSTMGPNARRDVLMKVAVVLESRTDLFVTARTGETGSTEGWARFKLMLAVGMVREAAALTTQVTGEIIPSDKPGCIATAVREPAEVVLGIAPPSAPIILGVRAIVVPNGP